MRQSVLCCVFLGTSNIKSKIRSVEQYWNVIDTNTTYIPNNTVPGPLDNTIERKYDTWDLFRGEATSIFGGIDNKRKVGRMKANMLVVKKPRSLIKSEKSFGDTALADQKAVTDRSQFINLLSTLQKYKKSLIPCL